MWEKARITGLYPFTDHDGVATYRHPAIIEIYDGQHAYWASSRLPRRGAAC